MRFDSRFSSPSATPTPWEDIVGVLEAAELYWLTTVRADSRPHVTPLIGVWHEGAMHFATGLEEQKARNLETNANVVLTTGTNTWNEGVDVVIEGTAVRVTDSLQELAGAIHAKYGDDWNFAVERDVLSHGGGEAAAFRIDASKTFGFAKNPHAQTRY